MNQQWKSSLGLRISSIFLWAWAITTIYPILWIVMNSFKDKKYILSNSFAIPVGSLFTLDNYRAAFDKLEIFAAYGNSLAISVSVALVVMVIGGLAAYALVRYEFRGKQFLYSLVVAGMMFPVFSTIIPVYRMMNAWGIVNPNSLIMSLVATALPQIAGNTSFAIIVLMSFLSSLPIELEESAYLEGCHVFQIFFRVIMPLAKPAFSTVAIFSFLWSYNDLFTQSFFLRGNIYAITRLLNELTSIVGTDYGLMAAAVSIVIMPILLVYLFLQKYIIKGMIAGAIKG